MKKAPLPHTTVVKAQYLWMLYHKSRQDKPDETRREVARGAAGTTEDMGGIHLRDDVAAVASFVSEATKAPAVAPFVSQATEAPAPPPKEDSYSI